MRNRTVRFGALIAALAMTAVACNAGTAPSTTTGRNGGPFITTDQPARPRGVLASFSLVPFNECETFLDYVISHAVDLVGPYGLGSGFDYRWSGGDVVFESFAADDGGQEAAALSAPSSRDFSGTNVQVLGVDEPDMVKTDGERIVILAEGRLIVADVTGDEPRIVGTLQLENLAVQNLFLSGDQVLSLRICLVHLPPRDRR